MAAFGVGLMIGSVIAFVTGMLLDSPGLQIFGIFGVLAGGLLVALEMGMFS